MSVYVAINNLINEDTLFAVSSEDPIYIRENIYNRRPSFPFRFTGAESIEPPSTICIDLGEPTLVTIAAIFNHNLMLGAGGDGALLKGCADSCLVCDWDNPGTYALDLGARLVTNWNDLYSFLSQTFQYWRFEFIDSANPDSIELGEVFLGQRTLLDHAYLQPGWNVSPKFYRSRIVSPYGQSWRASFSETTRLSLKIKNIGDPEQVNQIHQLLRDIHDAGGQFVIVPKHNMPFVYYVEVENEEGFREQLVTGEKVLSEWTLNLLALTKGIKLLG